MGLAPFDDLDGAHFLVLWTHDEVHSAIPSRPLSGKPDIKPTSPNDRVDPNRA
jgi:hypothetical protein